MKSFITSAIILSVTVILVTVNNIFVTKHLDKVINSLSELPEGFDIISSTELEDKTRLSLELFEQHLDFLSFSISARDLRDMHSFLSELYAAGSSTDEAAYSTALYKAVTFAGHLKTRESFSLKNVV